MCIRDSASFALGDYEWMLAFEADELYRIVDLMRHLRASDARRHVREEVPFYTGSRVGVAELVDRLPEGTAGPLRPSYRHEDHAPCRDRRRHPVRARRLRLGDE